VIVFLLLGYAPVLLVLTLVIALYLTALEAHQQKMHFLWWAWWLLLVLMTHFVGYIIMRVYVFARGRRQRHA
jgi:hypothetical protein